jgi:hypothetical protein
MHFIIHGGVNTTQGGLKFHIKTLGHVRLVKLRILCKLDFLLVQRIFSHSAECST